MAAQSENRKAVFVAPRKADEWNKNVHNSIKWMHQSLSKLYENLEETQDLTSATADSDEVTDEVDEEPFSALAEKFIIHCDSLSILLRTCSKWPVRLPLISILKVLTRCLKVTSVHLKSKPSLSELAEALPRLHISALTVQAQLILCCGSHVLPWSKMIVDVCLSSLAGTKHAKCEAKSTTRGKVFDVLCIMVERFGWGRYLQSHSQSLIQHLISDISIQEAPTADSPGPAARPKQEVESIAQRKSKKKKKGKKLKGDSYSDLPVYVADDDSGNSIQSKLFNAEATKSALALSHLIVQRAEFSQVQTLVRSLLDTSRSFQREGCAVSSSYTLDECRRLLYSAVFSCSTVRLGQDCDRKSTISHFQVTNLAMTLLTSASHSDPSVEVQKSCSESLLLFRNTGNLNRPIVRKVLPDDQIITKDIAEMERDTERLAEENKGLWRQLVEAQLELEAQGRELQKLRQSIALNKAVESEETQNPAEDESEPGPESGTCEDSAKSTHREKTESSEEECEEEPKIDLERKNESVSRTRREDIQKGNTMAVSPAKGNSPKPDSSSPTPAAARDKKKRLMDSKDDEVGNRKKAKPSFIPDTGSEDIQDMISDFVDSVPDQA